MNQEKIKQAIDDYFDNMTREKFKSDLTEAGFSVTDNNNAGVYAMPGKPITVKGENAKKFLRQLDKFNAKDDLKEIDATDPRKISIKTRCRVEFIR